MIHMKLDDRIRALIAVGASITANCQPCLQSTITMALESGADEQEIAEAIEVGRMVRKGAASKMDKFASSVYNAAASFASANDGGCGCGW
jgi:AhpD family alkylhydroperoxidase